MRRFLVIAIPIAALALFIAIMLSGDYLKKPLGKDDHIPQTVQNIIKSVQEDDWDGVERETKNLEAAWKKVVRRVQYSAERDEINSFTSNLARLRGAIIARDRSSALIEVSEAYQHWESLGQ